MSVLPLLLIVSFQLCLLLLSFSFPFPFPSHLIFSFFSFLFGITFSSTTFSLLFFLFYPGELSPFLIKVVIFFFFPLCTPFVGLTSTIRRWRGGVSQCLVSKAWSLKSGDEERRSTFRHVLFHEIHVISSYIGISHTHIVMSPIYPSIHLSISPSMPR